MRKDEWESKRQWDLHHPCPGAPIAPEPSPYPCRHLLSSLSVSAPPPTGAETGLCHSRGHVLGGSTLSKTLEWGHRTAVALFQCRGHGLQRPPFSAQPSPPPLRPAAKPAFHLLSVHLLLQTHPLLPRGSRIAQWDVLGQSHVQLGCLFPPGPAEPWGLGVRPSYSPSPQWYLRTSSVCLSGLFGQGSRSQSAASSTGCPHCPCCPLHPGLPVPPCPNPSSSRQHS